ncbi:MAG: replication-relaxation family protein [Candidatus Magasanikiibacteriota bacterium]
MFLNTIDVTLTPRKEVKVYNVQMNTATLKMLSLIFEFKLATAWQITRFLKQRDKVNYIYLKLRRLWQAGLLESFKVFTGSRAGMPVYYMLSKGGLEILNEAGGYDKLRLKNYPQAKTLLSWNLFRHEAEVVELASLEAKNTSGNLKIIFKGETESLERNFRSDKNIEVLTPDYTVFYLAFGITEKVYSEYERTQKSVEAMLKKIERYVQYLNPDENIHTTLRFVFHTPQMEQAFWLGLLMNKASFLQKLRIFTTNLSLLESFPQFLEPIYVSEQTVKLIRQGRLTADLTKRIKLFSFL